MAELNDDLQNVDTDDTVELVLINPETNLPYDEDDPVVISAEEFRSLKKAAEEKGMTFEEYFTYIIKLAIEHSTDAEKFKRADFELEKFEDLK